MKLFRLMEISNMVTGVLLLAIGLTYMYRGDVESGASWLIFGAMYLVMDLYNTSQNAGRLVYDIRTAESVYKYSTSTLIRAIFCGFSTVGAMLFLVYIWV